MTSALPPDLKGIAQKAVGESEDKQPSLLEFLGANVRPRAKQEWTLEGHEYLEAIALDPARVIVIEKAAQVGASTLGIGALFHTAMRGHHVGYFLDTQDRMQRFVQGKVDPIINHSDELTRLVAEEEWRPANRPRRRGGKSADNVRLKKVGTGKAYFLSTKVLAEVKSIDLDMIMMDEVAELDPEIVEFAQDRLLHSDLKREWWYSQPDIPEMDIDDHFQRSSKRYWKLRCRRCRTWTALELAFPDCLFQVRGQWRIGCPRCHAELHRADGEWVAIHPDREVSGYHISQLYGPHVDAPLIADQWGRAQRRPNAMRRFMISVVGVPFAGERQPITDALLNTRCGEWGLSPTGTGAGIPMGIPFAGVDVGDVINLWIARYAEGVGRTVWLEETTSWDTVAKRLRDHNVAGFVVDARPEKTKAKELCRALGNGAIIYTGAQQQTTFGEEDKDTDPVRKVSMNRTDLLDALVGAVMVADLWLPRANLPQTAKAREHLKRLVKDRRDDGTFEYRKNVENHYAFAAAHMLVGVTAQHALGLAPAGHFGKTDEHLVGSGYAAVRW